MEDRINLDTIFPSEEQVDLSSIYPFNKKNEELVTCFLREDKTYTCTSRMSYNNIEYEYNDPDQAINNKIELLITNDTGTVFFTITDKSYANTLYTWSYTSVVGSNQYVDQPKGASQDVIANQKNYPNQPIDYLIILTAKNPRHTTTPCYLVVRVTWVPTPISGRNILPIFLSSVPTSVSTGTRSDGTTYSGWNTSKLFFPLPRLGNIWQLAIGTGTQAVGFPVYIVANKDTYDIRIQVTNFTATRQFFVVSNPTNFHQQTHTSNSQVKTYTLTLVRGTDFAANASGLQYINVNFDAVVNTVTKIYTWLPDNDDRWPGKPNVVDDPNIGYVPNELTELKNQAKRNIFSPKQWARWYWTRNPVNTNSIDPIPNVNWFPGGTGGQFYNGLETTMLYRNTGVCRFLGGLNTPFGATATYNVHTKPVGRLILAVNSGMTNVPGGTNDSLVRIHDGNSGGPIMPGTFTDNLYRVQATPRLITPRTGHWSTSGLTLTPHFCFAVEAHNPVGIDIPVPPPTAPSIFQGSGLEYIIVLGLKNDYPLSI